MKKTVGLFILLTLTLTLAIGCSKSEEDLIRESRAEQGIEHLSSENIMEFLKEAKMAHISIFNGTNDAEEYRDEDGITYNPFFEHYDSPDKIRAEVEKYYYGAYAEEIIATIPAKYIENTYVLPIGDIGYIEDFDKAILIEKKDIDEENIELSYRLNQADTYHTFVKLKYDEGRWKISSEIMVFEEEVKDE